MKKILKIHFNDQNFNQNGRGISKLRNLDASDEGGEVNETVKMHHIGERVQN